MKNILKKWEVYWILYHLDYELIHHDPKSVFQVHLKKNILI